MKISERAEELAVLSYSSDHKITPEKVSLVDEIFHCSLMGYEIWFFELEHDGSSKIELYEVAYRSGCRKFFVYRYHLMCEHDYQE